MKKFLAIFLAAAMLCLVGGCSVLGNSEPDYVNPVADDPNYVVWNDGDFTICFPKTMNALSENPGVEEGTILSAEIPDPSEVDFKATFEVQRIPVSLLDFTSAEDMDDATAKQICDEAVAEIAESTDSAGMELTSTVEPVEYVTCGNNKAAKSAFSIIISYPDFDFSTSINLCQYYIFDRGAAYIVSFTAYDEDCDDVFADVMPYIFVD